MCRKRHKNPLSGRREMFKIQSDLKNCSNGTDHFELMLGLEVKPKLLAFCIRYLANLQKPYCIIAGQIRAGYRENSKLPLSCCWKKDCFFWLAVAILQIISGRDPFASSKKPTILATFPSWALIQSDRRHCCRFLSLTEFWTIPRCCTVEYFAFFLYDKKIAATQKA